MAYVLNYTNSNSGDPEAKGVIVIENYNLNGPTGPNDGTPATNPDLTIADADTSLLFYGHGMPNYGERLQENMLHLMEHFYSDEAPVYPTIGQVWCDYNIQLNIFNGTDWTPVVSVPPGGSAGMVLAKVDGTDYNVDWVPDTTGVSEAQSEEIAVAMAIALG